MVRLVALTPDAMRVQMADEQRRERGSRPAGSCGGPQARTGWRSDHFAKPRVAKSWTTS